MKKVSASLGFDSHQMKIGSTGIVFDDEFLDKLYAKEEDFRSQIILPINEFAGGDWSVNFIDFCSPEGNKYIVDITVSNSNFLPRIVDVVTGAFPNLDFSFYVAGEHSPFSQTPYFMYDRPSQ